MEDNKVITATYQWTEEECVAANEWANKSNNQTGFGKLFKRIIVLMLIAFIFMNLVVIFIESTKSTSNLTNMEFWQELYFAWGATSDLWFKIVALLMIVFGLFWLSQRYLSPWAQRRYVKKHFSKHPDAETTIQITIDGEAVMCEIGDGTTTINKWKVFSKVVQTKGGFLLYIGNGYTWIPNHAFNSKDDLLTLSQLVIEKSICFEEVE
jgi:hypothetical protein